MTRTTVPEPHRHVVQAAALAPSVHNTQPWRFTAYEDGLDLWADPQRQLPVLDPEGRQLHLSCGAALLHARVAARGIGLDPLATLLPDPADTEHLARLQLRPGEPATQPELELAEAILRRHTHRDAVDAVRLPAALLERLRLAADREGATMRRVTSEQDLLELEVLLARADRVEEADPAYRQEVADWVRSAPADDGIAPAAMPPDPERGSSLRLRDFGLAGERPAGGEPPVAERPDVVVLVSADDTPLSWLQTGQALGALLLVAAQHGVLAQPLGQVTDLPVFRSALGRSLGLLGTAQLALRLGYATSAATAPRRDVSDVLDGPPAAG